MWKSFTIGLQITKLCAVHDFIQGHAVTLTFKVATQMMRVHIVHIATYSRTKFHAPSFNSF